MKNRILIAASALLVATVVVAGVVLMNRNKPKTVFSNTYSTKELESVELNEKLSTAVDKSDLAKVKTAVLENDIPEENQERLATLIEEYGAENALSGYSYLNNAYVTWEGLESFVENLDKNGVEKAVKEYEKSAPVYVPTAFKRSQLEEWINVKGYPAEDITSLDKLAQLYGKPFDEFMERYENGTSIGEIKAELGLINTSNETKYITINESDVQILAEKCGIGEREAENTLTFLVRMNFDAAKLPELDCTNKYELYELVLGEKYGGEKK